MPNTGGFVRQSMDFGQSVVVPSVTTSTYRSVYTMHLLLGLGYFNQDAIF